VKPKIAFHLAFRVISETKGYQKLSGARDTCTGHANTVQMTILRKKKEWVYQRPPA
jgi:hypothetical protein